jgi:hypothetical protein
VQIAGILHPVDMKLFLVPFLLCYITAFAQVKKFDTLNIEIAAIKRSVKAVDNDSKLTQFVFQKSLKEINNDTLKIFSNLSMVTYTAYYNKENMLKKISILGDEMLFAGRSVTAYYFKEGKIICIHKNYINASRMGSCGAIPFNFRLFFHNGNRIGIENLIKKRKRESFFDSCYPLFIDDKTISEEVDAVLKIINSKH